MSTMRTGEIFAIDRRVWSRVCDLGVNAAISFLIIARGTGGDNRTTSWSVNAIEKYTSISRPRAALAVKVLIETKILSVIKSGKRPQYRVALPADVPGIKLTAAEKREPKPEWIWMPNSVVDGLSDETPPVEILRQAQNIDAIRMFGNLYFLHDLPNNSGIGWRDGENVAYYFEREVLGNRGEYVAWGFPKRESTFWRASFLSKEHHAHSNKRGDDSAQALWAAVRILENSGLLQFVGHLVEARGDDAEIIHPLPIVQGDGEPLEKRIAEAARTAAEPMCSPTADLSKYWAIVPVRRHMPNVQLVGIARLRYRPQTAATAAWLSKAGECEKWVRAYQKLAEEVTGNIREVA